MDFVRNLWYVAMWSQDLKAGELTPRVLLNDPVVLYRNPAGVAHALEDVCPHRLAPLHMGKLSERGNVACAYHGLEFDGTGTCVYNPHASGRIPKGSTIRSYPVVEKHSLVWIWMGDRAADPATIPDFGLLDGHQPVSKRDWLLMQGNYQLVVDNLLDVSHTSFLHDGILGSKDTIKGDYTLEEQTATQFMVKCFRPGIPIPRFYDLLFRRDGQPVDNWMDMRWSAPGCLINNAGVTTPGGDRKDGTGIFGTHFITPQTDTTCWYHFAAVRNNPIKWGEPIDTENMQQIAELRRHAFEFQDKLMIEGQQRELNRRGGVEKFMPFETDLGIQRARNILEKLIRAEREERGGGQRAA